MRKLTSCRNIKLLGRVDENTGEIVPTSVRRGRPPKSGPVAKRQLSQIPASDKEGQANDQKLRTAKEKANVSAPSKPIDVKKSDSSHSSAEEDRLHHEIESKNNIIVNQSKQIAELTVQLQAVQRAVSDFQAAIAKILSNNH